MTPPITQDSPGARDLRERLEHQVGEGRLDLPLLPASATQVLTECGSEDCDSRKLAELIQGDPALSGHVLRVANSVVYAPEEPIVSLHQAVSRMGFSAICGIAVSVVAKGQVFSVAGHERRLQELWVHCATTAAWAKEIARSRRRNVEAAFLSGLLHDVGKPIVLDAVLTLCELAGLAVDDELLEGWMTEFHDVVGARLLTEWNLPAWVQESVAWHHDPESAPQFAEEARTVALADDLAHWSRASRAEGEADEVLERLRRHPTLEPLGIYVDELEELLERSELVEEVAKVFE